MEEKLVELFNVANEVNEKQDKIYFKFEYCANDKRELEIEVVNKETFSIIERANIMLTIESKNKLDAVINILKTYLEE